MGNADARLLLIGLDNSGKTTVLSRIVDPNYMELNITPTIGFRKDKFTRNGIDFQVFDMSGQSKYRDLWQSNASSSLKQAIHGIIFVVDSTDRMRLKVAKNQLQMILQNKLIPQYIPYLFYANKSDIKGACPHDQIEQMLGLKSIVRNYQLVSCSGLTGKGVQQGVDWLAGLIKIGFDSK